MKAHSCIDTILAPPKLAIRSDSHTISKQNPPKIRIIHIVAPEIIKTDVENFRELVQKLTGKPLERRSSKMNKGHNSNTSSSQPKKYGTNQSAAGTPPLQNNSQRMKREYCETRGEENPNAFLSFLGDHNHHHHHQNHVDHGFMHDVNEFPLLSFRSSHQMNSFGEMPLC